MRWPTQKMLEQWPVGGKLPLCGKRQRMVVQWLLGRRGSCEQRPDCGSLRERELRHCECRYRFLGVLSMVWRPLERLLKPWERAPPCGDRRARIRLGPRWRQRLGLGRRRQRHPLGRLKRLSGLLRLGLLGFRLGTAT